MASPSWTRRACRWTPTASHRHCPTSSGAGSVCAAIATPIEELVDRGALMALEAVYVERKQNLRDVLRVAQAACLVAAGVGAGQLLAQHVFTALEQNPPIA